MHILCLQILVLMVFYPNMQIVSVNEYAWDSYRGFIGVVQSSGRQREVTANPPLKQTYSSQTTKTEIPRDQFPRSILVTCPTRPISS